MKTVRLTAAQAMVKWLSAQMTVEGERFIGACPFSGYRIHVTFNPEDQE